MNYLTTESFAGYVDDAGQPDGEPHRSADPDAPTPDELSALPSYFTEVEALLGRTGFEVQAVKGGVSAWREHVTLGRVLIGHAVLDKGKFFAKAKHAPSERGYDSLGRATYVLLLTEWQAIQNQG